MCLRNKQAFSKSQHVMSEVPLYSRPMPRDLWRSWRVGVFQERSTPVPSLRGYLHLHTTHLCYRCNMESSVIHGNGGRSPVCYRVAPNPATNNNMGQGPLPLPTPTRFWSSAFAAVPFRPRFFDELLGSAFGAIAYVRGSWDSIMMSIPM